MENGQNKPETKKETNLKTEIPTKLTFIQQFEAEQNRLQEAAVAFDIDDFTKGADDVQTVYVPNIGADGKGRTVHFKRFNAGDGKTFVAHQKENRYDQGLRMLALMMFKADGKTTFEKLKKMPAADAAAILKATQDTQKFFQPQTSNSVVSPK